MTNSGIYANDSYFKAPISIGTDFCILFVLVPLFLYTYLQYQKRADMISEMKLIAVYAVAFYYAGYVFNGNISSSNLFATNHEPTATSSSFNAPGFPLEVRIEDMSDSQLLKGLYNGLVGVQAGEECVILFSGKYGFGKKAVGTIPANSALAYHIWVESINND